MSHHNYAAFDATNDVVDYSCVRLLPAPLACRTWASYVEVMLLDNVLNHVTVSLPYRFKPTTSMLLPSHGSITRDIQRVHQVAAKHIVAEHTQAIKAKTAASPINDVYGHEHEEFCRHTAATLASLNGKGIHADASVDKVRVKGPAIPKYRCISSLNTLHNDSSQRAKTTIA